MSEFYNQILDLEFPFIIADIGSNHNGDMNLAKKMIDELDEIGCDVAKFQSWTKETLWIKSFYKDDSLGLDKDFGTFEEMVERFSINRENHDLLSEYCSYKNIIFSSTPFSYHEADMLCELDVPFFKIASMDLNNLGFLEYVAKLGKPIVLSTGMGSLNEIDRAVNRINSAGNKELILLHCIAIYPPKDDIINLNNIRMLKDTFNLPVGFSDHTKGTSITLAAIAMGAKIIEKHYTLNKKMAGWDHAISADKKDMRIIIDEGKRIVTSIGNYKRNVSKIEMKQRENFRRSIVLKNYLTKGSIISKNDLDFKRPGIGIKPDEASYIIGRKLKRDKNADELIYWDDIN